MGTLNVKGVGDLKNELIKSSSRGFGHFMKNFAFLLLAFLVMFILTNPDCITNPKDFFGTFSWNSLWIIFVVLISGIGLFQLGRSLWEDERTERSQSRIDEYEEALKKKDAEEKQHHAELVKKRFEVGPHISNELKNLLINLDADRAAILEMHNGTNNASGLPFIYADMVYEEISPKVGFISDEFKNLNLAKLPFVANHYKEKTWIGPRNDIDAEDAYFGAKLRLAGVEYGAIVILEGINGPIGFLTLFFANETKHPTKAKIIAELNHSSQIISTLLDKTK